VASTCCILYTRIQDKIISGELIICFEILSNSQNLIHEEIKSRLNSGNAWQHSIQIFLSSRLMSEHVKIKVYKSVILPVVLYGCETLSLTIREEHRRTVFQNSVLRIFGPKRMI
jgi:hypothetical protein